MAFIPCSILSNRRLSVRADYMGEKPHTISVGRNVMTGSGTVGLDHVSASVHAGLALLRMREGTTCHLSWPQRSNPLTSQTLSYRLELMEQSYPPPHNIWRRRFL